ncbi:hypothetical protein PV407_17965 [Paenibacillus sp. GYB003]
MTEAAIFEKRIELTYEIEPDVTVRGNSEQLKQIVLILLDNALKYTEPGGTIRILLKRQHLLFVCDNVIP